MVRITLLLFVLFPIVFGAKELLEENGMLSEDKDAISDDVMVKRSVNDIAARRRSALDKNFMRFGRSDPDLKPHGKSTQNPCGNKICDRINNRDGNMMRFGRSGNNLMRFGRGNNPMRFGRGNNNLMRFGRGNLMRFGRGGNSNPMRFGRSDEDFERYLREEDCDCGNRDDDNNDARVMKLNDDESYDENKIDDALLRFAKIISNRPAENEPDNLSELFPDEMRKKRSLKTSNKPESDKRNLSEHPVPYYS